VAASFRRPAGRADTRSQWIARFIDNDLVAGDEVMQPIAREVLAKAGASGRVVLVMDQTKASDRHQILMLSLRFGERALPLAWQVEATERAIGFAVQQQLLEAVAPWLPPQAEICLMADRFHGTRRRSRSPPPRGWGIGFVSTPICRFSWVAAEPRWPNRSPTSACIWPMSC